MIFNYLFIKNNLYLQLIERFYLDLSLPESDFGSSVCVTLSNSVTSTPSKDQEDESKNNITLECDEVSATANGNYDTPVIRIYFNISIKLLNIVCWIFFLKHIFILYYFNQICGTNLLPMALVWVKIHHFDSQIVFFQHIMQCL